jgi:hypothetical protein
MHSASEMKPQLKQPMADFRESFLSPFIVDAVKFSNHQSSHCSDLNVSVNRRTFN